MAQKLIMNIGLERDGVYLTDVPADGLPPAISSMNWIGDIVPESLKREDDDDTEVQLKSQESGNTVADLLEEEGTKKFTFATWDFKTENLIKAMGGSVDANGSWNAPLSAFRGAYYAMAYKSRANADTGLHVVFNYPKVKLKGKQEGIQVEGDGNKLQFTGIIFTPENALGEDTPSRRIDLIPTAPTGGIVDNDNDTFKFTEVSAFPNVGDYEFSIDNGVTFNDVVSNPITGLSGAIPVGNLQVRVKGDVISDTKHLPGFTLKNKEAFTV